MLCVVLICYNIRLFLFYKIKGNLIEVFFLLFKISLSGYLILGKLDDEGFLNKIL